MNKTKIEWVKNPDGTRGYTWNPITGCLNHVNGLCKGGGSPCYAYKLANGRLKQRYLANSNWCHWNPPARFWRERLEQPYEVPPCGARRKYKGIFVCDMGELFGDWVPFDWQAVIFNVIRENPWHRFYLLTKQPQNLIKWSPFPENCYVGVTATDNIMFAAAYFHLTKIEAKIKYISLEPLLAWDARATIPMLYQAKQSGIEWIIIGACTGSKKDMEELGKRYPTLTFIHWKGNIWTAQPRIEDLKEIVEAAIKAGVKVFLKDNLRPLLIPEDCSKPNYLMEDVFWASDKAKLRQELPDFRRV